MSEPKLSFVPRRGVDPYTNQYHTQNPRMGTAWEFSKALNAEPTLTKATALGLKYFGPYYVCDHCEHWFLEYDALASVSPNGDFACVTCAKNIREGVRQAKLGYQKKAPTGVGKP